jgi:glycogen operon protein
MTPGRCHPLGATVTPEGVNFAIFSRNCTALDLLLFEHADATAPSRIIHLDPRVNRTCDYWHIHVPALLPGQVYAYRAFGPWAPERGHRFDPTKLLLDPYGRGVAVPDGYDREAARRPGDNAPQALKSVVVDPRDYDWEDDIPLRRPISRTVIYEMHVAGFTRNPNSGISPEKRGTYAGLVDKIPYLVDLGITAVELLPVFAFDPEDAPPGRTNYWGYCPISFFAPHGGYSSRRGPLGPLNEFRDLVKAFHRAGIEVILDVVFNHTAEGNHEGPTICFKGLENSVYYILESDRSRYANYTGTGNTLNANHPTVRRMIVDSLRYWVEEMHVDGFRFDLASILSRDESGLPMSNPPVLWDIDTDPALAGTKLIAEAWDAAGLYQVGSFTGTTWKEWNGRFRDDIRSFIRGETGSVRALSARLLGSPDLYGHEEREPEQSINFVTCHDGFTLNDLVSYNSKHNEANGEGNRDGSDDNRSWNCGVEGPTDDPEVEALRERQIRNVLALNLLALGAPMLLMGDEARHSQGGNNNAYCQDNEVSWFDWDLVERNAGLRRFVRELISQRLQRDVALYVTGLSLNALLRRSQIEWHGVRLDQPDWGDTSHTLAVTLRSLRGRFAVHLMINAWWEELTFDIPPYSGSRGWRLWLDTNRPSPDDIYPWAVAPEVSGLTCPVAPRSIVALVWFIPFPLIPARDNVFRRAPLIRG